MNFIKSTQYQRKAHNGQTVTEYGTFIKADDFGHFTQGINALPLSLHVLDVIEKASRLNMFLFETGKELINTNVFYNLLGYILEKDRGFTDHDKEQYFSVVKEMYKHTATFHYIADNINLIPAYELDMFVLGGKNVTDDQDQYADLNYYFMNDKITYSAFVNNFERIYKTENTTEKQQDTQANT